MKYINHGLRVSKFSLNFVRNSGLERLRRAAQRIAWAFTPLMVYQAAEEVEGFLFGLLLTDFITRAEWELTNACLKRMRERRLEQLKAS